MYWNAESVTVDDDEGRFTLVIEDVEGERVTVNIHNIDLDAFYEQVRGRIGPYLREMHEAQVTLPHYTLEAGAGVFACNPDESGGVEERVVAIREDGSYRIERDEEPDAWREMLADNADWSRKVAKGE